MKFLGLFFLPVCGMRLSLNVKRFRFLNLNDAPSILDDYFKL
jgi:hypothetical protein